MAKTVDTVTDRRAIILAYHNEAIAISHRNIAGSLADFSTSWFARLPKGGKVTYLMLEQVDQNTFPYQRAVVQHDKILSLMVKGNYAQVRMSGDDTQVLVDPHTRQTLSIETNMVGIDYWQRRNGHWLHDWTKVLAVSVKRNGQLVDKQP